MGTRFLCNCERELAGACCRSLPILPRRGGLRPGAGLPLEGEGRRSPETERFPSGPQGTAPGLGSQATPPPRPLEAEAGSPLLRLCTHSAEWPWTRRPCCGGPSPRCPEVAAPTAASAGPWLPGRPSRPGPGPDPERAGRGQWLPRRARPSGSAAHSWGLRGTGRVSQGSAPRPGLGSLPKSTLPPTSGMMRSGPQTLSGQGPFWQEPSPQQAWDRGEPARGAPPLLDGGPSWG